METGAKNFSTIPAAPLQPDSDAFARAIKANDAPLVERYLREFPGAVNWVLMPHSDFCIHVAVKAKNFDIIPLLQQYGADINAPSVYSGPALVMAQGKEEIGKLTALGAKFYDPRWRKSSPLTIAILSGRSDDACAFIEAGADPALPDITGWTALMYASKFVRHWNYKVTGNPGQAYMAQYLLARPGIPDEELQVCLKLAEEDSESAPAALAIGQELERREAAREADRALRQAAIDSCLNGTAEKTVVMKPLKLGLPARKKL